MNEFIIIVVCAYMPSDFCSSNEWFYPFSNYLSSSCSQIQYLWNENLQPISWPDNVSADIATIVRCFQSLMSTLNALVRFYSVLTFCILPRSGFWSHVGWVSLYLNIIKESNRCLSALGGF